MLAHWIWFAHRPGLGDRGKATLLQHFSGPEEIYFADHSAFEHIPGLTSEAKEALNDKDMTKAEETLELCRRETPSDLPGCCVSYVSEKYS